eukprot:207189-Chlamydomonas_euryale.AAC.1
MTGVSKTHYEVSKIYFGGKHGTWEGEGGGDGLMQQPAITGGARGKGRRASVKGEGQAGKGRRARCEEGRAGRQGVKGEKGRQARCEGGRAGRQGEKENGWARQVARKGIRRGSAGNGHPPPNPAVTADHNTSASCGC